jgi:hypothetical protein
MRRHAPSGGCEAGVYMSGARPVSLRAAFACQSCVFARLLIDSRNEVDAEGSKLAVVAVSLLSRDTRRRTQVGGAAAAVSA